MLIVRRLNQIDHHPRSVVTIGSFDGVHLGHQAILSLVIERASVVKGRSVVVTFEPHPREVVGRGSVQNLTTLDERLALFSKLGIDVTYVVHFTHEFSQLSAREFYMDYISKHIGLDTVIIGYDHMFGRNREGGTEALIRLGAEMNFHVEVVDSVSVNNHRISSSLIRESLQHGDVESTSQCLGRPYMLQGKVVAGDGRGKQLGFPTANLKYADATKLIPAAGVYFVRVLMQEQEYFGMMNIGIRPTFHTNGNQVIEVHLFDVEQNLYDETLTVEFIKRIRSEQKFSNVEQLIEQLKQDQSECKKIVSEIY